MVLLEVVCSPGSPPLTLDDSCSISKRTPLPLLICGLTLSITPTSSRLTVVKGLPLEVLLLILEKLPVTKGTSSPTLSIASSLSKVTTEGVDSILVAPSFFKA